MNESQPVHNMKSSTTRIMMGDYNKAKKEVAEKHLINTSIRNTDGKPFPICNYKTKDFGAYGLGLELYFLFLKQMGVIFLLMALISMPILYFNVSGDFLDKDQKNSELDRTTIANQKGITLSTSSESEFDQEKDDQNVGMFTTIYCDLSYCIFFVLAYIFILIKTNLIVKESRKKNESPSDYSVEVRGLPKNGITETMLKLFFKKNFGPVVECVFARYYHGAIGIYKDQAAIDKKIKEEKVRCELKGVESSSKLRDLEFQSHRKDDKLRKVIPDLRQQTEMDILRAYVIFDDVKDKVKCCKAYSKWNSWSLCGALPKRLRFMGCKIRVFPTYEPSNVNWENLEISGCQKFWRSFFALIVVILLLIVSFVVIYAINIAQDMLPSFNTCLENEQLQSIEEVQQSTNEDQIYCYCYAQSKIDLFTDSELKDECSGFISKYLQCWLYRILSLLGVAFINIVLKFFLRGLSKFQKFDTITGEVISMMKKLFVAVLINMALLVILINANFQESSFFEWVSDNVPGGKYVFKGDYTDFERMWYIKVGGSIMILMGINIFWPHIINLIFWKPYRLCKRCCASKRILQMDLNQLYEGAYFDLATRYSYLLANIFVVLIYSSGMPLLILILACHCLVVFWVDKYLILTHYKKPPAVDHKINSEALQILPYALFLHLMIAIWVFGCPDVYPQSQQTEETTIYGQTMNVVSAAKINIQERIFSKNGYPFFVALILMIIIFIFKIMGGTVANICKSKTRILSTIDLHQDTFTNLQSTMASHSIISYDIKKNPQYMHIIYSINQAAERRSNTIKVHANDSARDPLDKHNYIEDKESLEEI